MPEISQPAPDFTLPVTGGGEISLSDLRGKAVVLYFYPRDDTPGCTKEAVGFSEHLEAFADAGAVVFGVSRDTMAKHDRFAAKHTLTVPLLADIDGAVTEAYGVWVEKNMYGKKSMGIERATYLIDASGNIARIWRKVKVAGHVEEVLDAVRAL
ncbi:Putative peroxiredoxin bcp [Sulfitobacter pontiacus]|jgi:peroxiredoxin Q/BCP|uniref:thioredoxin-dependent peroxiredoxin n=1 Tax=Sulfitobacter pontiacus TaxID=60137 RepID=A0AAX3AAH3_9RHOB|nr:peroxiredoxin [Sulfitobacter pontiacus]HBM38698.1 peroxiredoxin [Sulfitobacter sp.]QLL42523.1 peroxiredoxin [Sulfitobacter pontiacus]UOA23166.1 Putative peroxiredoxin bcp [Sulfitobacter pontiacus]UWR17683.1 peroxiredoxin [Sulfitobacter pontiacus]WPZ24173.1 peroxiredoxin [Sulfitobacter pontiacus]|tara:strand:- start:61 stop:522 length:462 start_codon:yes stop_codon:yes gene_type:complete